MFKTKINPKRLITVGGTLFCAWGIGFLMQSNAQEAAPQAQGVSAPDVAVEPLVQNREKTVEEPVEISEITLTSAIVMPVAPKALVDFLLDAPIVPASLSQNISSTPITEFPAEEEAPTFACEHELKAEPAAAAMVTLTLNAPCMANDRFTIHHNGMMFTDVMDASGKSTLEVPALARDAVYIISFGNGEGAVAKTSVTSLEYYDRVVVQWAGNSGLQIHALEYGATYQGDGHVWRGQSGNMTDAARGEGGFVSRYGAEDLEGARIAEVYTFPSGTTARQGDVRLSVETEITKANCGRDIEAQSMQLSSDGTLKVQDLTLAIPDCDAVGDFLVLKNLLNDLKIARN